MRSEQEPPDANGGEVPVGQLEFSFLSLILLATLA